MRILNSLQSTIGPRNQNPCPMSPQDPTSLIVAVLVTYHMREVERLQALLDRLGQPLALTKTLDDFQAENDHMQLQDYLCFVMDTLEQSARSVKPFKLSHI